MMRSLPDLSGASIRLYALTDVPSANTSANDLTGTVRGACPECGEVRT
jgi:hypothetical protein